MRLWHYKTISFLPTAQLLGQWRECCAIASRWAAEGTPRHALVNPVLNYPIEDYIIFCKLVYSEMCNRGYYPQEYTVAKLKDSFVTIYLYDAKDIPAIRETIEEIWRFDFNVDDLVIFEKWHNQEYLEICYWNLEEKYLCGCIPEAEWQRYLEGGKELI